LGWLKIKERLDLSVCVTVHKILNNCAPEYLSDLFTVTRNIRSISTRFHKLYFQAPLVGKNVPDGSFSVMGYRLWNDLKPEICAKTLTILFKKKLEIALLLKYKS
jgi:hypothetical protein